MSSDFFNGSFLFLSQFKLSLLTEHVYCPAYSYWIMADLGTASVSDSELILSDFIRQVVAPSNTLAP